MINQRKQPAWLFFHYILFASLLFFIFIPSCINAQEKSLTHQDDLQLLISNADSILGADDELINGVIYIQENLFASGHPFFLNPEWKEGSVTVNGEKHDGLFLKYNINTDELILRAERKRGGTPVITLNNEFIDNFYMGDRYYVNSMSFEVKGIQTDFVEQVYLGSFTFYVSYSKLFKNDYNNKTPYGSYAKTTASYFLLQNSIITNIASKKALFNYFEPYKKDIKKFMKRNKIKYKKTSSGQLRDLMQYCDQLTTRR